MQKSGRIFIRIEPEHKASLVSLAERRQTTMSEVLRTLIRREVQPAQRQDGQPAGED